jgi:small nuclear ribonucleoprotein (snRNP)-like protein
MPPLSALHPVTGTLKGYDQLLNLVLDDVEEEVTGTLLVSPSLPLDDQAADTSSRASSVPVKRTRTLGLTVLRGPTIVLISPVNGSEGASFSARRPALLTWPLNLLVRRLDGPGLHGRPAATTQATAGRSCASFSSGHLGSDSPNPSAGARGVSLSDKPTKLTLPYLRPLTPAEIENPFLAPPEQ